MSGVDNRIVTMQFNNRDFEQNARTSLSTLQKLKESMNFGSIVGGTIRGLGAIQGALSKIGLKTPFAPMITAANKGLGMIGGVFDRLGMKNPFGGGIQGASELQRAAQAAGGPQGMGVLEGGVTAVSSKFIALTTIAVTALSNITNKAISSTTAWLKSFTIAPIMDGLNEYQTTLQSIQTVQANTDRPLPEIEDALKRLNAYSDTTIYNFGQMAKNVGTFTAAGVDLETSTASIQGIANIAALSGSSAEQAASAMYQLSQAIASGKVGLMDWNSVVNAGMGGKKLQNALAQTAIAMGEISKESVKLEGPMKKLTINGSSFRESIMAKPGQESWLSSDILVNTLASLDGRFSVAYQKAQLTEQGVRKFTDAQIKSNMAEARANLEKKNGVKFSDEQYKALLKMANASTRAAQDVKTLGQVFDIAKETIGSGWAASFNNVFGNLKESKKLFTGMSNGLGDIIRQNALARNELLASWKEKGGRDTLIDGLKDAWTSLWSVIQAVGKGFHDVFPKTTPKGLVEMTQKFADFMHNLLPGKETLADIRDIASGVASIFSIFGQVLSGVGTGLKTLFDTVGGGNGDFLGFLANIGNSIQSFDQFLEKSGLITTFFETLGRILAVPLALLAGLGHIIGGIFSGFDKGGADKVKGAIDGVGKRLSGLEAVGQNIRSFFSKVGDFFGNLGERIGAALMGIGDMVAKAFTAENFGKSLDVINTTLLGGIILLIRNFFKQGVSIDLTGGLFDDIKKTLGSVTGAFQNMQQNLKADILRKIAIAIGIMAAALLLLSMISPGDLTKALAAMSAGFGILIAAMATLMKVMGPVGLAQMYVTTAAMTKMALSILLLASALKIIASIPFGDMLRGLLGLGVSLWIIKKALIPMAANSKGMGRASASLILLGIALNILALALKVFASMSWEEMIRGMAGLAGTLLILSAALKIMPDMKAEGIGLVLLGAAMIVLAVALKIFATMSWEEMAKGLIMLAGSLLIIAAAIKLMPKTMMLQAVALVAVAGAMTVLAGALKIMGSMGWENIAKGLIVMGGAMVIIAAGLNAIGLVGTIGAIGLLAAAAAMAVMLPVMVGFGAMDWTTILKSLTMLAGIFVILGLAGYLLAPVVLVIIGLAGAMLLLGAGFALLGAGALMVATGFGIVVATGSAGVRILAEILGTFIKSIPAFVGALAKGFIQFVKTIAAAGPVMVRAMSKIIGNILDAVIKNVPKMGRAFMTMLDTGLKIIVRMSPKIFDAGLRLIVGFLTVIDRNIGKIVDLATSIITKFINAIGRNIGKVIDAGVRLIIKFVNGVANAIDKHSKEMGEAGGRLAVAIVRGMANGISGAAGQIKDAAVAAARGAIQAAKDFLLSKSPSKLARDELGKPIPQGMAIGIEAESGLVSSAAHNMGRTAIDTLSETMRGINDVLDISADMNPTVTPVLDLSQLTKEANKMSSILATAPIMPTVSYQAAAEISTAQQADQEAAAAAGNNGGGDTYVKLEQNIHSPKALDSVTIYRDSKSLISLAKETLK